MIDPRCIGVQFEHEEYTEHGDRRVRFETVAVTDGQSLTVAIVQLIGAASQYMPESEVLAALRQAVAAGIVLGQGAEPSSADLFSELEAMIPPDIEAKVRGLVREECKAALREAFESDLREHLRHVVGIVDPGSAPIGDLIIEVHRIVMLGGPTWREQLEAVLRQWARARKDPP